MIILSFSGIDGAGKTTQISSLENWLSGMGLRHVTLTFWDNVVAFSRFRETVSCKVFKGDKGVGSPENPLNRRDKNVASWPVSLARLCFYFADAISLKRTVAKLKLGNADVVIFDRYIYDELANLPLGSAAGRTLVRWLLKMAPEPDIAFILDADPAAARARKPEYPLEFVRKNREAYLAMARLAGAITIVGPASIEQAESQIKEKLLELMSASELQESALRVANFTN
ncbi:MAG TPA: thymidylate kinase [Candidatus Binatia bacterium]|nr:thymidylate kinase [Candidatus Binatia bacterium]